MAYGGHGMIRILRVLLALAVFAQLSMSAAQAQTAAGVAGRVVGGVVGVKTCWKHKFLCGSAVVGGLIVGNEINKWKESKGLPGIGHNGPPADEKPEPPKPNPPPRVPPPPWIPKSTNERQDASSAVNRAQMQGQLSLEQAGIIDRDGHLTQSAISSSTEATTGLNLKNPKVIERLTSDGSRITDWSKRSTQSVDLPSGERIQVHFYYNRITGKVDRGIDYKVKGDIPTGIERHKK